MDQEAASNGMFLRLISKDYTNAHATRVILRNGLLESTRTASQAVSWATSNFFRDEKPTPTASLKASSKILFQNSSLAFARKQTSNATLILSEARIERSVYLPYLSMPQQTRAKTKTPP